MIVPADETEKNSQFESESSGLNWSDETVMNQVVELG